MMTSRALHDGTCSQEKNKMEARSEGGFTCCVPGCFSVVLCFPKGKEFEASLVALNIEEKFQADHRTPSM